METKNFIVAEKSYLIRKGIVSIINRVDGALVIKELDNIDHLNSEILNYNPDFLIINPNLIPRSQDHRNFQINMEISEKVIALTSVSPFRKGLITDFRVVIDIHESKEQIFSKIASLIEPANTESKKSDSSELSEREKTILAEVARGLTNKEIADKLYLSTHTVITHRKNITNKLGIKTISGLTVYAILNKLITLDDVKQ